MERARERDGEREGERERERERSTNITKKPTTQALCGVSGIWSLLSLKLFRRCIIKDLYIHTTYQKGCCKTVISSDSIASTINKHCHDDYHHYGFLIDLSRAVKNV